jgi:hypothetical protein
MINEEFGDETSGALGADISRKGSATVQSIEANHRVWASLDRSSVLRIADMICLGILKIHQRQL